MIGVDDLLLVAVGSIVASAVHRTVERRQQKPSLASAQRLAAAQSHRAMYEAEAEMQRITRRTIEQMLDAAAQQRRL